MIRNSCLKSENRWEHGAFTFLRIPLVCLITGRWGAILGAILLMIILPVCPLPVHATGTSTTTVITQVLVQQGSTSVQTGFMLERLEAPPFEENGLLFVPISFFSKAMSAVVDWDLSNGVATITLNSHTSTVWLGRLDLLADGRALILEAAPQERQGIFFVPLSTLAIALGCTVQWDLSRQATVLTYTRVLAYSYVPTLIYPEYPGMDVGVGQYVLPLTPLPSEEEADLLLIPEMALWAAYVLVLVLLGWLAWAMLRKAGVKAVSSWVFAILFVTAVLGMLGVYGIQIALADPHDLLYRGGGNGLSSGVWDSRSWQFPLGPPSSSFGP